MSIRQLSRSVHIAFFSILRLFRSLLNHATAVCVKKASAVADCANWRYKRRKGGSAASSFLP